MELVEKGYVHVVMKVVAGMDRTQRYYSITRPGCALAGLLDT
jgi:predicted ArsR family transcriptional regulator